MSTTELIICESPELVYFFFKTMLTYEFFVGLEIHDFSQVLIMDVGGLPQLFISRLSAANSIPGVQMNRLDLVHLVDYPIALNPLNKYHILSLIKDYSSKEVVLLSLFNPGDAYYFNVEHSAREDILFGHKDGSGIRTRILLKVGNWTSE